MASKKNWTTEKNQKSSEAMADAAARGSGSDLNSDQARLDDENNLQDKTDEDSFPASDAPSRTPMSGTGRTRGEIPTPDSEDFKENKAAQFEYGRQSQASTQHFDTSTDRLRKGNPDVGDVDLGTIEADRPAQKDDDDLFDSADDVSDQMLEKAEKNADIRRQNSY